VATDKAWEFDAAVLRDERTHADWLFSAKRAVAGKNLISNCIARGPDVGLRPQAQRLRATYLVKHIEAGDSVKALMRIAGMASLDALARYVRFVG
jgi:hypothetical protein